MEKEKNLKQIAEINQMARFGAEIIISKIGVSSIGNRLFLRNDNILNEEWYQKHVINHLEFFSSEEGLEDTIKILKELFSLEFSKNYERENIQNIKKEENLRIVLQKEKLYRDKIKYPRIPLKIWKESMQISFEITITPYIGKVCSYEKKSLKTVFSGKEEVFYYIFSKEEYLSRGFYEIISNLEQIDNVSWYKEIYDIIIKEVVEGRKVSQIFESLLLVETISSIDQRLDIIKNLENNKLMKKRWKSQSRCERVMYPQWDQVIKLLVKFFTPILEGVLKGEIFIGDWMPQIGRYLN